MSNGANDAFSAQSKRAEGEQIDPFVVCTVVDVFAFTGAYRVDTPFGDYRCVINTAATSATPLGATQITQSVAIGDSALCWFPVGFSFGFVLSTLPSVINDGRFQMPDSIVCRSESDFFHKKTDHTVYENDEQRMVNASMGRASDVAPGDWGVINEFGVAMFMGKFMAMMRASDNAKIEAFWGDDLLRIFGWNLQQWTAAREAFLFDDEGEYSEVTRTTPFMWESMGAYDPGEEVFEKNEGDAGSIKTAKAYFEPKEKKQVMVFRSLQLGGYLGDIERSQTVIKPADAEGLAKQDSPEDYRGLLEVHKMLDGTYAVRSSKQIILEKSFMLPVPWQERDPDDNQGDHAAEPDANYKAANHYGSGDSQEKKPYEWSDDENPMTRGAELWEQEEYLFGKYGLQAIDAHEKDWETAEAADIQMSEGERNILDDGLYDGKLEFKQFRKIPKYAEVEIDQRDGYTARYYKTRSCFHMLDDGSIVIEDGYGSQIIMSGGNIELSCQGDVWQRPGRSAITWAPRDIIQRAGWCAELTAAKKDIRIKGQNNVHVFAGDGEKGNIMMECRAKEDPKKAEWEGKIGEEIESKGIILKCKEGTIDLWSNYRVFAGASKNEEGIVEISSGSGRTTIAGKNVGIEATEQFGIAVADRPLNSNPAQFGMDKDSAYLLVNRFDIDGDVGIWQGPRGGSGLLETEGGVDSKGNIRTDLSMVAEFSMTADTMNAKNPHNSPGEGEGPGVKPKGGDVAKEASNQKQLLFAEFDIVTLDNSSRGQGNAEVQDAVGFSFRKTKEHYKIEDDFRVVESRWQQLYRAFGIEGEPWDEPVVKAPDGETDTRPHPGQDGWESQQLYKELQFEGSNNVEYETAQAKTRQDQSEQPPQLEDKTLKDRYVINVQTS